MIIYSDNIKDLVNKSQSQKIFDVIAGGYIVTDESGLLFQATLGSCVSVCMFDKVAGVGGMNHISLPKNRNTHHEGFLYGSSLMEKLINESSKLGATKKNMVFKVFGGAKVIDSPSDVGWLNIGFVFDFLQTEGYTIAAYNVGDVLPRSLQFTPTTGKVMMKQLAPEAHKTISRASAYTNKTNTESKVELFQ